MIQLMVYYRSEGWRCFPIPPDQGWRVDTWARQIIIGHGIPRTHIPLDNVLYYELEQVHDHPTEPKLQQHGAPPQA